MTHASPDEPDMTQAGAEGPLEDSWPDPYPEPTGHTVDSDVRLLLCAVQDTSMLTDEQAQRVATVKDEEMLARQEEVDDER